MCFGKSGDTTPPKPQQPTRFDYSNQTGDSVQRQAAVYESKGMTNRASFGADLTSGPAAPPSASPATTTPGGV